jgi:hypothetical protein
MADERRIGRQASRPLTFYRTAWAWLVTVGATVGALTAFAMRPTDQFIAVAVTGLSLGACAGCLFDLRNETVTVKSMVVFGFSGAIFLLALLGLGAVFGVAAVLGGVAVVVLSPWSLSMVHRLLVRSSGPADGSPQPPPVHIPDTPAQDLGDRELLKAWRASSVALCWVGSDDNWLTLARRRQEYLSELERRDPRGFNAWMATKPDMDDDPSGFLFHKNKTDSGTGDS